MTVFTGINNHVQGLLFVIAAFLFIFSSGFIFFDPLNWNSFAHDLFKTLCHQFHWRTYAANDLYMATCTRCFGIYSGMFIGCLSIPFIRKKIKPVFINAIIFIVSTLAFNFIDFTGNFLGLWTNTLHSRMMLGIPFGFSISYLILTAYYIQTQKK